MTRRNNALSIQEIISQQGTAGLKDIQIGFAFAILQMLLLIGAVCINIGYIYVLLWLVGLHLFVARHYWRVISDKVKVWVHIFLDYPLFILGYFSVPLFLAMCILNFYPWPESFEMAFFRSNVGFTKWLKTISFLDIPQVLHPEGFANVMLIYSYTLVSFASAICGLLSTLFWWPMSHGLVNFIRNQSFHDVFLMFLALLICLFLAVGADFWILSDYGYYLKTLEIDDQEVVGFSYSNFQLLKQTARWAGNAPVLSMIGGGIIACILILLLKFGFNLIREDKP